jgi:hypothetical protein
MVGQGAQQPPERMCDGKTHERITGTVERGNAL